MSVFGVFLIALAGADICGKLTFRHWAAVAAGPALLVAGGALCGLRHLGDIVLLAGSALVCVTWVQLGRRVDERGDDYGAPLTALGAGVTGLLILAGWTSPVAGAVAPWLRWVGLDNLDPDRAVLILGVLLVQLVTANQVVRLVLGAVGNLRPAGEPQPSDQLKGGRLLGPLERLLIVGLGLGGQLGAASAVVAAKGIIRFPELSAQRTDGSGIDEVTEYFLVGSFTSWLIAMAGLALTMT